MRALDTGAGATPLPRFAKRGGLSKTAKIRQKAGDYRLAVSGVATSTAMNDRNVILTGFMGTGKTSVGQALAARLGYAWVDTDALIESKHGPVTEIFAAYGEGFFREIEASVAAELARRRRHVISTGGHMMLDETNAALLSAHARVFCLTASPDTIVHRLAAEGNGTRPLLAGDDPAERIRSLLAERAEAYAAFEQVPTDEATLDDLVDELVRRLGVDQPSS